MTASELLKKNFEFFGKTKQAMELSMIEYAKLKCEEQRKICREKPPTARKCYPIGIIMKNLKPKTFEEAVRPLMQWMAENCHPHTKSIVESNAAELFEGLKVVVTDEYLTD